MVANRQAAESGRKSDATHDEFRTWLEHRGQCRRERAASQPEGSERGAQAAGKAANHGGRRRKLEVTSWGHGVFDEFSHWHAFLRLRPLVQKAPSVCP